MKLAKLNGIAFAVVCLCMGSLYALGKKDYAASAGTKNAVVASTSWTAAFADLAGINDVTTIAPTSLRHPPEYELTVQDLQTIASSSVFIYAGFERMMQTIGTSAGAAKMVQIPCDNSIATVQQNAKTLSALFHTEQQSERRVQKYIEEIEAAKKTLAASGLAKKRVFCNINQTYLAEDLGLNIAQTFGPAPVTSLQIADAATEQYDIIIDNIHNPVGSPLAEVTPQALYLTWRNFPEQVEKDALLNMVRQNIQALLNDKN